MRTVRCPDCGRPAVEVGRFTVDDTEYARLRCGEAPALLFPAAALAPAVSAAPSPWQWGGFADA